MEAIKKRRGRPPKVKPAETEAQPTIPHDASNAPETGFLEDFPGVWETKQVGSFGRIYASFDTQNQFWVELGEETGRTARISLKQPDGQTRVTVVENVKEAKPQSVRAYWPNRSMSNDWLYEGRNPFAGSTPRTMPQPNGGGASVVEISSGKL